LAGEDQGEWEQPEFEREIFHFRLALPDEVAPDLRRERVCQILTNLGNVMLALGRPVEAIEYWDRALQRLPGFSMALGNRGYGLSYYAASVHGKGPTGPALLGMYNQMKQEFISARYLYYEGITWDAVHFADKGVRLYDTLDSPIYSLAVEKTKVAFRMVYSILDKIAFFLKHYLDLSIPDRDATFRKVWYREGKRKNGLEPVAADTRNWPLRGLFWLSKDLHEDDPEFRDALELEAQELRDLRHALEHRYLKLSDEW